jgi:hypothetical protein
MEALDAEKMVLACEYYPPTMTWYRWSRQGNGWPIATSTGTYRTLAQDTSAPDATLEVIPNRERGLTTLRPTLRPPFPPGFIERCDPQIMKISPVALSFPPPLHFL